jgi:hypothetical protein
MKTKVNWREVAESVWTDKWEAILGIAGLLVSLTSGLPWWALLISAALIVILAVDLLRTVRRTIFMLQEKNIPLAVIVGREREQAKAVINEVLTVMERFGFEPRRYASDFDVEHINDFFDPKTGGFASFELRTARGRRRCFQG